MRPGLVSGRFLLFFFKHGFSWKTRQGKLKICVISVLSGAWGLFIFFRLDAKENGTKRKNQSCISATTPADFSAKREELASLKQLPALHAAKCAYALRRRADAGFFCRVSFCLYLRMKNRIRLLRILRVKRICFFAALCFFNRSENSFFPCSSPSAPEKSKMSGLARCAA